MPTYLLIMGVWLVAAAVTAVTYTRLAAFDAATDARVRRRPLAPAARTIAFPAWILAPLAFAFGASLLLADFGLPETRPGTRVAATPSQAVRMAAPAAESTPRGRSREPARRSRRPAPRRPVPFSAAVAAPVAVAHEPQAVTAARSRPHSTVSRTPARRPAGSAPAPAPAPVAVAAVAQHRLANPLAGAEALKKWTVHPPSKWVPGRVHPSQAPAGRPRCACR